MRKNKFMRAASGLLVAVLLTTCVISGTFAKYVTKSTGEDAARVATWGFNDTSNIKLEGLFKTAYQNDESETTVKSKNTEKVIAPGTTNEAKFKFTYTGEQTEPEVAYNFKVDTTGSVCDDKIKANKNIVWKLDDKTFTTTENSTAWDQLISAIKALSGDNSGTKKYEANSLPTNFGTKDAATEHTVSWEWKYNTDDASDVIDTEMGNMAELDDVKLVITITAEQID